MDTFIVLGGRASIFVVDVLTAIAISAWVGGLVLEELEQTVETHGEESTKKWTHPVDPVVAIEALRGNIGSE